MAMTARTYKVVRPDRSTAERPNPSEEEIKEARLLNYQQMYRDTEQTQAAESTEAEVSEGLEESDDGQSSEDYSRA